MMCYMFSAVSDVALGTRSRSGPARLMGAFVRFVPIFPNISAL